MAIFKVTGVTDFTQLKSEISKLQSKPIRIQVETQPSKLGIGVAQREINQLGTSAEKTGGSISNMFTKLAAVSPVYAAVRAFREALDTMKAVDTELVSIQKVTGYTAQQMDRLSESAYNLASQYGRTADEVLAAATTFARAGYGDQIEALAELSLLTQNVGDVSADTASKFIIAADAAWELGGNETKLRGVLDGLNQITNKHAVDMAALTEAITVGGSVFAEAGESAQTFAALVGAGVASTQRSGSEIARALRTILMNIRQIRGETEDGELIDGESIANASKALKEYAGISTMANGQLRRASDVLDDLAEKWEKLDTVAQSAISEALAGKRQSNVLMALMGDWEEVERAIADYANGAGSALEENEYYLNSWEAKSKQLSAAWTEFVSHLIDTGTITDALDTITTAIDFLDSDMGRLVITTGALVKGVEALSNAASSLKNTRIADKISNVISAFTAAKAGGTAAGSALTFIKNTAISAGKKLGIAGLIFGGIARAVKEQMRPLQEYEEATDAVTNAQEKLAETSSEYDDLISRTNTLTEIEKKRLEVLKDLRAEEEKALDAARKSAWEKWNSLHGTGALNATGGAMGVGGGLGSGAIQTETRDIAALREYNEELARIKESYQNGQISADDYYNALQDLNSAREEDINTIQEAIDAGWDVSESQRDLVNRYNEVQQKLGIVSVSTSDYVKNLLEAQAQTGATGQALYDLVAAQITASNTGLNFTQQMAALQELALQAGYTVDAINAVFAASGNVAKWQLDRWDEQTIKGLMRLNGMSRADAEAEVLRRKWSSLTTNYTPSASTKSPSYSPSSTGTRDSTSSAAASNAAARKSAQDAIKQLQNERDAELDAIQEQIDALQKQADIEDQQAKIEEYKLEILKKQDALMNARNERTVRQYNAATGQWEWVADATKVKKAEEELEDAKKDLRDYESKVELDLAVEELKTRQEAIKAAYQIKIDAWQDYLDGLADAVAQEKALLNQSVANNKSAVDQVLADNSRLNDNTGGSTAGSDNSTGQTSPNQWIQDRMKDGDTLGEAQRSWSYLYIAPGGTKPSTSNNMGIGTGTIMYMQQWYGTTADGKWGGNSYTAAGGRDAERAKQLWLNFGDYYSSYAAFKKATGYYDEGGILQGMGGIKATPRDEIVLPPKLAAKMLTPLASQTFRARVSELGYMYGSEATVPKSLEGSSITDSHNVTTQYIVNGAQIGAYEAEHMSMADVVRGLAEESHHLQGFGNGI